MLEALTTVLTDDFHRSVALAGATPKSHLSAPDSPLTTPPLYHSPLHHSLGCIDRIDQLPEPAEMLAVKVKNQTREILDLLLTGLLRQPPGLLEPPADTNVTELAAQPSYPTRRKRPFRERRTEPDTDSTTINKPFVSTCELAGMRCAATSRNISAASNGPDIAASKIRCRHRLRTV